MSFGPENIAEVFPQGLRIEQKIAWLGSVVLATSVDIAAISPSDAEYTAIPGGGMLVVGLVATAINIYRRRSLYDFDPDDPEREDIEEPTAEIIEFPKHKILPLPQEKAA